MNFELTKTEQLFRQMIREFAENEVKPLAAEIDEEERFPVETVEKMAKLGIFGIPFPVNYGGAGGNNILYSMAVEELSRVCATTGVVVSAHTSLCAAPIYEHGTEEQKMKYLPKLCSGEWLGAFGLTEPNAGTDAAAQQTTAVDAGDHYILNGNKIFITNAAYAHVYIVMAMTDKSQGTRGISAFIVERDFPGFSIGKKEKKMGIRGSATCELIFENCIVPKENLLGMRKRKRDAGQKPNDWQPRSVPSRNGLPKSSARRKKPDLPLKRQKPRKPLNKIHLPTRRRKPKSQLIIISPCVPTCCAGLP